MVKTRLTIFFNNLRFAHFCYSYKRKLQSLLMEKRFTQISLKIRAWARKFVRIKAEDFL